MVSYFNYQSNYQKNAQWYVVPSSPTSAPIAVIYVVRRGLDLHAFQQNLRLRSIVLLANILTFGIPELLHFYLALSTTSRTYNFPSTDGMLAYSRNQSAC